MITPIKFSNYDFYGIDMDSELLIIIKTKGNRSHYAAFMLDNYIGFKSIFNHKVGSLYILRHCSAKVFAIRIL